MYLHLQHIFCLHGIPADIVSDRSPHFTCQVWKAFCQSLGATPVSHQSTKPKSNSHMERANQDLEVALLCPPSWSSFLFFLSWVEYAHNSLVNVFTSMDLQLQVDSRNLAPYSKVPTRLRIINPTMVQLKLPLSLKVNPTFHISLIKLVPHKSSLPSLPHLLLPDWITVIPYFHAALIRSYQSIMLV